MEGPFYKPENPGIAFIVGATILGMLVGTVREKIFRNDGEIGQICEVYRGFREADIEPGKGVRLIFKSRQDKLVPDYAPFGSRALADSLHIGQRYCFIPKNDTITMIRPSPLQPRETVVQRANLD